VRYAVALGNGAVSPLATVEPDQTRILPENPPAPASSSQAVATRLRLSRLDLFHLARPGVPSPWFVSRESHSRRTRTGHGSGGPLSGLRLGGAQHLRTRSTRVAVRDVTLVDCDSFSARRAGSRACFLCVSGSQRGHCYRSPSGRTPSASSPAQSTAHAFSGKQQRRLRRPEPRVAVCPNRHPDTTATAKRRARSAPVASRNPGNKTGNKLRRNHNTPETQKA
jgi:hypothetical protein